MIRALRWALAAVLLVYGGSELWARGGGGGGRSSGGHSSGSHSSGSSSSHSTGNRSHASPGTGATSSSTNVRGYTRKDGTRVQAHKRSKADGKFENNWSTKGNTNPSTGKDGTRVNKPPRP